MSSFEIGASRPVGAVQLSPATPASAVPATTPVSPTAPTVSTATVSTAAASTATATPATQVETNDAIKAGEAPVDANRVELIKKAIEKGDYPVIPTKISDAMIAAGVILRGGK